MGVFSSWDQLLFHGVFSSDSIGPCSLMIPHMGRANTQFYLTFIYQEDYVSFGFVGCVLGKSERYRVLSRFDWLLVLGLEFTLPHTK